MKNNLKYIILFLISVILFIVLNKYQYNTYKVNFNNKLNVIIEKVIEKNPNINEIHLHLDRDLAGRNASSFLEQVLKEKYKIKDATVPFGKDMNEYLCLKYGAKKIKKERTR